MALTDEERARADRLRAAIRRGDWAGPTAGARARLRPGQPRRRCPRPTRSTSCASASHNPQPCPVLEVTDPGALEPGHTAPGADLRTDLPRYRVYRDGELVDETDGRDARTGARTSWRSCSAARSPSSARCSPTGLPVRHIEQGVNVPMYRTAIACRPAGRFAGPLVVSMRPMRAEQAIRATADHAPLHPRPRRAGPRRRPGRDRHRRHRPRPTTATRSRSATARCPSSGPAA